MREPAVGCPTHSPPPRLLRRGAHECRFLGLWAASGARNLHFSHAHACMHLLQWQQGVRRIRGVSFRASTRIPCCLKSTLHICPAEGLHGCSRLPVECIVGSSWEHHRPEAAGSELHPAHGYPGSRGVRCQENKQDQGCETSQGARAQPDEDPRDTQGHARHSMCFLPGPKTDLRPHATCLTLRGS